MQAPAENKLLSRRRPLGMAGMSGMFPTSVYVSLTLGNSIREGWETFPSFPSFPLSLHAIKDRVLVVRLVARQAQAVGNLPFARRQKLAYAASAT